MKWEKRVAPFRVNGSTTYSTEQRETESKGGCRPGGQEKTVKTANESKKTLTMKQLGGRRRVAASRPWVSRGEKRKSWVVRPLPCTSSCQLQCRYVQLPGLSCLSFYFFFSFSIGQSILFGQSSLARLRPTPTTTNQGLCRRVRRIRLS